jgi:hypothetical protein
MRKVSTGSVNAFVYFGCNKETYDVCINGNARNVPNAADNVP